MKIGLVAIAAYLLALPLARRLALGGVEAAGGATPPCRRAAKLAIARAAAARSRRGMASWRSGYAEDCKSLHPGSIPGEASTFVLRRAGGARRPNARTGRGEWLATSSDLRRREPAPADGQRPVARRATSTISTCWRRFLIFRARLSSRPSRPASPISTATSPRSARTRAACWPPSCWRGCSRRRRSSRASARSTSAAAPGYGAAILAHLGANVVGARIRPRRRRAARERSPAGGEIEIVEGDLATGRPARAPSTSSSSTAPSRLRPTALLAELAEDGRLVGIDAALASAGSDVIERRAAGFSRRALFETRARTLEAFRRAPSFAF